MSTVFQGQSLPTGGSLRQLGPVRVAAKYPASPTKTGKLRRTIMVSDASGSGKLVLWGAAAETPIVDGQTYTIQSELKVTEYNGEKQFNADSLSLVPADGSAPPVAQPSPSVAPTNVAAFPAQQSVSLNSHEMAIKMAEFTMSYQVALMDQGADKEFAEKSSALAPQFAAQWFFGDKSPRFSDPDGEV